MRMLTIYGLVAAIMSVVPLSSSAQPRRHAPDVKEENNADHYKYEYDDGVCHYHYEYNRQNGQEHVDQNGNCERALLPRRPSRY
jgi:hypothetical protein